MFNGIPLISYCLALFAGFVLGIVVIMIVEGINIDIF